MLSAVIQLLDFFAAYFDLSDFVEGFGAIVGIARLLFFLCIKGAFRKIVCRELSGLFESKVLRCSPFWHSQWRSLRRL
jgi:hypothetical protein